MVGILTSIFLFQVTLAQQNQANFEGQHANLAGSLTEMRQREFAERQNFNGNCHFVGWIANVGEAIDLFNCERSLIELTYRTR